jgi:RNA polymerase sigma-70 factor (ECF subfamily)
MTSPPDPDRALLARWQAGDARAGEELFQRHVDAITRFFRNKVSRDVEDLVQDTFLGLVRSAAQFRAEASVRTLLFVIARRRLYDHVAQLRREPVDFTSVSVTDLGMRPPERIAARQQHRLLLRALRAIPIDHQIVLELYYWEELDGPELAEILDVAPPTVRSRLARARAALEQAVGRLAESPEAVATTLDGLDRWAREVREQV